MASSGASSGRRAAAVALTAAVALGVGLLWWLRAPEAAAPPGPAAPGAPVSAPAGQPGAVAVPSPGQPSAVDSGTAVAEAMVTASAPPSLAEQRLPGGTRFYGTVSDAHGAPPVHEGATCELGAVPVVGVAGECRIFLECGGYVLHGQPIRHTVPCSIANGQVDGVHDGQTSARDVDAAVEVAPGRGIIEVRDEAPGEYGRYTMRITIDSVEPARR